MKATKLANSRTIEMQNRLGLINVAYRQGYVAYLPVVDEGIDLILYREADRDLLKIQLKSRWCIGKKYTDRDISVAFPEDGVWYLAPHDEMVEMAKALGFGINTVSWKRDGGYDRRVMGIRLKRAMQTYLFPRP